MKSKLSPFVLLFFVIAAATIPQRSTAQYGDGNQGFVFAQASILDLPGDDALQVRIQDATEMASSDAPTVPTELMSMGRSVPTADHARRPICSSPSPIPTTQVTDLQCDYRGQDVKLKWITPCEHLVRQFIVKRTTDGINFVKVGVIAAQGNSLTPQEYAIVDADPINGPAYYCLLSKDFDDKTTCWGFVASKLHEKPALRIYGNPGTQDQMSLDVDFLEGKTVNWVILDIDGQLVEQGIQQPLQFGSMRLNMNELHAMKPGLYYFQIQSEETTFTRKIVIAGQQ